MKSIGYIIVSNMIAEGNKKVSWLYREAPTDSDDSGWRIFSGEEDDEYASNAKNFKIFSIESVLKFDSSIQNVLLSGKEGESYERCKDDTFIRIEGL